MLRDGDEDGIERRALTIESIGIVRVREGPWFVYDKSAGGAVNMMRFRVMHWGNLLSGARRAWERDPQKKNRAVQLSVTMGISRCRRYDENAPDDAKYFLTNVGNITNDVVTMATIPEIMASTPDIEKSWIVLKDLYNWKGLDQNTHNIKKFECVESVFKGRFGCYEVYEIANTAFKAMNKVMRRAITEGFSRFAKAHLGLTFCPGPIFRFRLLILHFDSDGVFVIDDSNAMFEWDV